MLFNVRNTGRFAKTFKSKLEPNRIDWPSLKSSEILIHATQTQIKFEIVDEYSTNAKEHKSNKHKQNAEQL